MAIGQFRADVRQSFALAFPVMISQLGHVMMGVVDNLMIGRLGAQSLAAVGLANVVINILLLFGIGVSYAITPLVAEADAARNHRNIIETLRHGLVINAGNALLLILLVLMAGNALHYLGQPPGVVKLSIPYLNIVAFSLLPALIFQSFRQFSEGLSDTRTPMVILLAANVLNIVFNYIFIYGHLGFPALGLNGAGWATLLSRTLMALAFAVIMYYARAFKPYRAIFAVGRYTRKMFNRMLHLGIPAGVQFIFEVAAFDFSLVMMGWLGTTALAAHQIAINLATISYMTTSGLAAAATIRVSHEYGKRSLDGAKSAGHVLMSMALVIMFVWAIIFVSGRHILPTLYIQDDAVLGIASSILIIAGLFQLSDGLQVVCIGALRGLQDVKVPSLLIFVSYWIIGLPLGYWLAFRLGWGANGIWCGLLIGLTITAIVIYMRFKYVVRQKLGQSA